MNQKIPRIEIISDQCKGCELCIPACKPKVIAIGDKFNKIGYQYATIVNGDACTGCDACYYACPEPGTIFVYKKKRKVKDSV